MKRLTLENITARHGLMTAVRDLSFDVPEGEVLCIVGANGAGKTTLMRTIAGAHVAAEGRVLVGGEDVTGLSAFARVRAGIAMSPEGRRLFADMTVRENLMIAGENGRKGDWALDSVVAAFPQIEPFLNALAGGLSGGQRQAVAIGRALMANPDVLLLDEVSLGLSPAAVGGVYDSLGKLKAARKMTMVIVEQDLSRAMSFADHIICMAEGVKELDGKPGALSKEAITQAYFGIHEGEAAHV